MSENPKDDYPTRTEKENMDEPQEEFISAEPPSSTEAEPPKAPHPNPEKDPDDWTTGDEPMTGPQMSYLKTLSQEAGVEFDEKLTKAEASKRIDALQAETGRGQKSSE
ncbi:MAG TPA: DUF3072 domain-containing protein [Chthoniobacterales bacterium]|jgi:hypothetical protein